MSRYSANNRKRPDVDATVDFIEVCNEPNDMWSPQQAPAAVRPGDVGHGLCETFESGGATRPAYKTWKTLPSFQ